MDALSDLINAVPDWHVLLDDLNGKIASRQYELAQVGDYRPPTRSLKNKGSTESLRPKDLTDSPIQDDEIAKPTLKVTSEPLPTTTRSPESPAISTAAIAATSTPAKTTMPPRLVTHSSTPGVEVLQRRTSNRLANAFINKSSSPPVRKRKTTSVASNDSQAPKYRTRSMIIVYYDSAVQHAFEELVKFISSSRNAMRKGKMAARMADMRRMAAMEADNTDSEDEEESKEKVMTGLPNGIGSQRNGNGHGIAIRKETAGEDDGGTDKPQLLYFSTRAMGQTRGQQAADIKAGLPTKSSESGLPPIPGMLRSSHWRNGGGGSRGDSGSASIFDELDTGLEWCQSMCEHAAHQFLRDGDCSIEIEGIKRRLNEVREAAERQQTINAAEEIAKAAARMNTDATGDIKSTVKSSERLRGERYDGAAAQSEKSRSLKVIQMRRRTSAVPPIEADIPTAMEVDEGYGDEEDEEELPKLVWRSARNL